MNLGSITVNSEDKERKIPVTCRQSDKKRANEMANDLRDALRDGSFKL